MRGVWLPRFSDVSAAAVVATGAAGAAGAGGVAARPGIGVLGFWANIEALLGRAAQVRAPIWQITYLLAEAARLWTF